MRSHRFFIGWLAVSSLIYFSTATVFAQTASGEWTSLFDGRTLDGWGNTGKTEDWAVENGLLACQAKRGGYLYTKDQYENYVLALDFKLESRQADSGVWLRWPDLKDPLGTGIQVQIRYNQCGALLNLAASSKNLEKPIGEWNHLMMTCDGPVISVEMNGEKICQMNADQYDTPQQNPDGTKNNYKFAWKHAPRKGHIGLQAWAPKVWFKDIKIKPLSATAAGPVAREAGAARTATTPPPLAPSLAPEQQVQAVIRQLKQLNPAFDGREQHKVEAGAVTELAFSTVGVTDIAPLKALTNLKRLSLAPWAANQKGSLKDLSPLQGLSLTSLWCQNTAVADLTPLAGMPLTVLSCGGTQIKDLAPLAGMKLQVLSVNDTFVNDLSPIAGMPLTVLWCNNTRVADLAPLKTLPLQELKCDFSPARDAAILRGVKTLAKINDMQAGLFWVRAGVVTSPISPPAAQRPVDREPLYHVDFTQEGPTANTFIVQGKVPTLGFVTKGMIDTRERMLVCRGDGGAYIPRSVTAVQSIKDSFTAEVVFRIADTKEPPKVQCVVGWGIILQVVVTHGNGYGVYARTARVIGAPSGTLASRRSLEPGQWHTARLTVDAPRKKAVFFLDGKIETTIQGSHVSFIVARPTFERIFFGGRAVNGAPNETEWPFTGDIRSFTFWDQPQPEK